MASIIRHTAVWSGSPGLPGYTQFYQEGTTPYGTTAQDGHNYVAAFFDELVTLIPEEITITVDPVYQVLSDLTGEVTSEGTVATPSAPMVGTYVSDWSRQVGILIEWGTGLFLNGRRFRGRTYLVPLGAVSLTNGAVPSATLAVVRAAAAVILPSTYPFVVWHRPVAGVGGLSQPITGSIVRDHAAILRSRMV